MALGGLGVCFAKVKRDPLRYLENMFYVQNTFCFSNNTHLRATCTSDRDCVRPSLLDFLSSNPIGAAADVRVIFLKNKITGHLYNKLSNLTELKDTVPMSSKSICFIKTQVSLVFFDSQCIVRQHSKISVDMVFRNVLACVQNV